MSARTDSAPSRRDRTDEHSRRLTTETKASTKTSELVVYVAAVIAVVITAWVVGDDGTGGGSDPFGASEALRYITYPTIGYMVARGLAKSGSRDAYDDVGCSVLARVVRARRPSRRWRACDAPHPPGCRAWLWPRWG